MLHDLIGVPAKELKGFIQKSDDYLVLSGHTWKHARQLNTTNQSVSVAFDKFFAERFKEHIESKVPKTSVFANGSIYHLLKKHRLNKHILVSDIRQYFKSIHFALIQKSIDDDPSLKEHSSAIQAVFFKDNSLRVGMHASPAISEIVGLRIDGIIGRICHKQGVKLAYSRYYDDLVFSCNNHQKLKSILRLIGAGIRDELGIDLNRKKTKIQFTQAAKVLGLRFHNQNLIVPKTFKNKLRAARFQFKNTPESSSDIYLKLRRSRAIISSLCYIIDNSSEGVEKFHQMLLEQKEEHKRLEAKAHL